MSFDESVPEFRALEITSEVVARRVLELQHVSYQIEAELIGVPHLPPMLETWQDLAACAETFFGAFVGENLVGVVSYRLEDTVLDVHRVMVRPSFFRRGIARALVEFAMAREDGVRCVIVSTGTRNSPAVNLYLKLGFRAMDDLEVEPGLWITRFEKTVI